jgi:Copper type II ascorbate-dependent monooxygenase, C-terminal domain/EF hand
MFCSVIRRYPSFVRCFAIAALLLSGWRQSGWADDDSNPPLRQAPRVLQAGSHGVGRWMGDASFVDLAGETRSIHELALNHRALVIAMTSTTCPLSKRYLPTLVELSQSSGDGVAWLLVNPIATDKVEDMKTAEKSFQQAISYVHDAEGKLANHVGALTTTDVLVLDSACTVVFHGAIDDQYGLGYSRQAPRHRYLADALAAMEAGSEISIRATDAPGCVLGTPKKVQANSNITYHNRISRIIQSRCLSCHRDGGVAPFKLDSFAEVQSHGPMIQEVIQRATMPPWFAAPSQEPKGSSPSPWSNDCSLEETEKDDFLGWLEGSMPEGDLKDAPLPRQFASTWEIGEPDVVFQFDKPQPVQATGVMPYKHVTIQTNLDEDKWIQAIEIRPGDRGVVHHVVVTLESKVSSRGERDGFWGVYVPGNSTLVYPEGFAKQLPKNAKLHFQMHYTPNGTATTDQTSIGLQFSKTPPRYEVKVAGIINDKIHIPAGAENHSEVATLRIPYEARLMGFLPHMHLRGKAARYELIQDDLTSVLLEVPRYDFNWQLLYRYRQPIPVSPGDEIRFTSWYDNSENNPANPDPTQDVRWGDQTDEEMQVGYVEYYVPGEPIVNVDSTDAGDPLDERQRTLFRRLDLNGDGVITKAEVRKVMPDDEKASGPIFDRLDVDNNGEVTKAEMSKLD